MYKVPRAKIQKRRMIVSYQNVIKHIQASLVHIYKLIKLLSKFVDHNNEVYLFQ